MEYFEHYHIDYRLFTPEYFQKKYKGLPEETYEFMAQRANARYYKCEMLQQLPKHEDLIFKLACETPIIKLENKQFRE